MPCILRGIIACLSLQAAARSCRSIAARLWRSLCDRRRVQLTGSRFDPALRNARIVFARAAGEADRLENRSGFRVALPPTSGLRPRNRYYVVLCDNTATEVTLVVESRKDGPITFTADASTA